MATEPLQKAVEVFSAPIEGVISALGRGIAEAQTALDLNSIKVQEEIDADPVLSRAGAQATWYQLPKVELELKLAMTMTETTSRGAPQVPAPSRRRAAPAAISPVFLSKAVRLVAQPVSASYQNRFNYDASASTTIRLTIVPVPSPAGGHQTTAPPRLTSDEVRALALESQAGFRTVTKDGQAVPDPALRFDVNFNGAARVWYVLQYDPADGTAKAVVVAIDDETGALRVVST
jgi:hypothetical protein